MKRFAIIVLGLCLVAVTASADVESGPKAGGTATPFKVFAVTDVADGKEVGKDVEIVKDRAKLPTAYVFVNADKFTRPAARYLKKLDEKADTIDDKAAVVVVWVHGDAAKSKDYLPKIQKSLNFTRTALTVFDADASGPKEWALNADAAVTTVIVVEGKIKKTFAYDTLNDTDAVKVLDEWKKSAGK